MSEGNAPESNTPTADAVAKFLKETKDQSIEPSIPEDLKRTEERNLCDMTSKIKELALSLYQRNKDKPGEILDDENILIEVGNEDIDGNGTPFLLVHDKKGVGTEYGEGTVAFVFSPGQEEELQVDALIDQQYRGEIDGVTEELSRAWEAEDPGKGGVRAKEFLKEMIITHYDFNDDDGTIKKRTEIPTLEDGAKIGRKYTPESKIIPSSIESVRELELVGGLLQRLRDGLQGAAQPIAA